MASNKIYPNENSYILYIFSIISNIVKTKNNVFKFIFLILYFIGNFISFIFIQGVYKLLYQAVVNMFLGSWETKIIIEPWVYFISFSVCLSVCAIYRKINNFSTDWSNFIKLGLDVVLIKVYHRKQNLSQNISPFKNGVHL
jgi:hypothetical protein